MFEFDVMDAKPNVVMGNTFHIRWSKVYLGSPVFNVSETAGILQVPVMRNGNLKQVKELVTKTFSPVSKHPRHILLVSRVIPTSTHTLVPPVPCFSSLVFKCTQARIKSYKIALRIHTLLYFPPIPVLLMLSVHQLSTLGVTRCVQLYNYWQIRSIQSEGVTSLKNTTPPHGQLHAIFQDDPNSIFELQKN